MNLEVGKTYKHIKAGGVIEVVDIKDSYYVVKLPYCDANVSQIRPEEFFMQFALPFDKACNFREVVVDSDGLVYELRED